MERDLFAELYQDRAPIIMKYLMKIGCLREDAEDIVQETFIKAIDYMVHVEEDNLSAWLFRVALNRYYDLCRRNKRRPQMMIEDDHFLVTLIEEEVGISNIIRQEEGRRIKQLLEELNPLYKNLILMKYDMDLSYKQIGEVLDMKEDKIRTYLYRARNAFKKSWEDKTNG